MHCRAASGLRSEQAVRVAGRHQPGCGVRRSDLRGSGRSGTVRRDVALLLLLLRLLSGRLRRRPGAHEYTRADGNTDSDLDPDANADGNANEHTHTDSDANRNGHAHQHADTHAHTDAHAAAFVEWNGD